MELLKERIRKDGVVKEGNVLKVDSFLNHRIDVKLYKEIGKEFRRRFDGLGVNKILTIEASGIGIACVTAEEFDFCPVVFAKKTNKFAHIVPQKNAFWRMRFVKIFSFLLTFLV